jgi:hypothetical protein
MAITIKYGTYTIPFIIDKFREDFSYRKYSVTVDILVTGTDDATFQANLSSLESALTKDSQDLLIKFGTVTHRDFKQSNYSSLKARGRISKVGDPIDTDRSRKVSWTCEIDLPANDLTNDNYRREATWSIKYDESRRSMISFQGVYTGGGGNTAKQNYDAQAGTWISSVFTSLALTEANYELSEESINTEDDEGGIISFSRSYLEVIYNDSSSSLNHSAIKNAIVSFQRSYDTESYNGSGATRISISYSCSVDKNDVNYGNYDKLKTLWESVIKPHLLSQAKTVWGTGSLSVIDSEQTTIDTTQRAIQSSMVVIVSINNNLLSYTETITITETKNNEYKKILDGQDDTYNFFTFGRKITANQTVETESIGLAKQPPLIRASEKGLRALLLVTGKGQWNLDNQDIRYTPKKKGSILGGASLNIFHTTYTMGYTYISAETKKVDLGIISAGKARTVIRQSRRFT